MTSLRSGVKLGLMKKLSLYIFLGLLLSSNTYAGMGDTYTCTTEKISQLDSANKITTDFKQITFVVKMEKLKKKNNNLVLCQVLSFVFRWL